MSEGRAQGGEEMKKIGEYTARGRLPKTPAIHKVTLFDGRFDTGYRIVGFKVALVDTDSINVRQWIGKLATVGDLGHQWKWDNQNELAWAMYSDDANTSTSPSYFSHWDEDALIIEDLYVYGSEGAGNTEAMNYEIKLEKYEFSDWKGALAMARDKQSE